MDTGYWKNECIDLDYGLLTNVFGIPKKEIVFKEDVWVGYGAFGYSLEYYVRGLELGNAVFTQFEGDPTSYKTMNDKIIDMGAGLERFSWGLATELGHHNIAVNILKPLRPVLTEGFVTQRPDADFSNWVSPEYMVKAAIFLANQTGQSMSGATVTDEELVRRLHL